MQFNVGSSKNGAVVLLDEQYVMVNNVTFVDAVSRILNYRSNVTRKGMYLRFHEPNDVPPVLRLLSNFRNISAMPIWLGAKVIQGPGKSIMTIIRFMKLILGQQEEVHQSSIQIGSFASVAKRCPVHYYRLDGLQARTNRVSNSLCNKSMT